jgi:hypothetical protein
LPGGGASRFYQSTERFSRPMADSRPLFCTTVIMLADRIRSSALLRNSRCESSSEADN